MDEAEASWKSVLKRETIASLTEQVKLDVLEKQVPDLQKWVDEKIMFKQDGIR